MARATEKGYLVSYEGEVMLQGCWLPMQDPGPCQNAPHLLVATGRRNVNQDLNRLTTMASTGQKTLQWARGSPRDSQGGSQRDRPKGKLKREWCCRRLSPTSKVEIWVTPRLQESERVWWMFNIHSRFVQLSYQVIIMARVEFCLSPHGNVRLASEHQTCRLVTPSPVTAVATM